jgi:four helix bundle protein
MSRRSRSSPEPSASRIASSRDAVEEEADETLFWIELREESGLLPAKRLAELKQEANELVAITVASIRNTKRGRNE